MKARKTVTHVLVEGHRASSQCHKWQCTTAVCIAGVTVTAQRSAQQLRVDMTNGYVLVLMTLAKDGGSKYVVSLDFLY